MASFLQVRVSTPSASSVAGVVSVQSPQAWPVALTTVSAWVISFVPAASLNSLLQVPQVQ